MKNIISVLVITLSLTTINAFQLQGAWSLSQISSWPTLYQPVTVQISDTIFRQTALLQNILFVGCQSYKYLLESTQNNLFISYSSIQYQTQTPEPSNVTVKCDPNAAKMHSVIRSKLVEVFYFKIVGNFLVFLDAKNQIVFKFQRIEKVKLRNLRGIWNLYSFKSTSISQKVQITDNQITLCKGRLILGYTLSDKYGFKTRLISNDGCDVEDLQKTALLSVFSRRVGTSLEIYNSNLDVIMLMSYVQELDLSSAQQARLKAIEDAKINEEKAAKARADAQLKAKAEAQAQAKLQAQQAQVATSLSLSNTKEDLLGLWQPVTIFGMPMDGSSVYFIFSSNLISYNGGCNTFQFQYTPTEVSKTIQIGQNKSTSNTCQINDDGLYVNGLARVSKYAVSIVGKEFRLKLSDVAGNVLYELRKTVKIVEAPTPATKNNANTPANNVRSTPTVPTPTPAPSQPYSLPGLQNGRYIFLILARRDLPRKFLNITDGKITYSGCSAIEHTVTVTGKNQLKITGGPKSTTSTCAVNNDETMTNAFNSITTFGPGVQTGSYILRNARNEDVINLSQF